MLKKEIQEASSVKSRTRQRYKDLTVPEVVAYIIRQEKEIRAKNIDQKEAKLPLLAGDTATYFEHPKGKKKLKLLK